MNFTINLATRTYLDHRLLNRIAYCAIAVLLIAAVWNINRVSSALGEQSRLGSEIATVQNRLAAKPGGISDADFTRQKGRVRFYNTIIERKSRNWLSVLELFENATPEGISLSSLATGKNLDEWKLEGHAGSFKTVRQYLEKLEASKSFSDIMLLSHKNLTVGDKVRGVQFAISCKVLR